MQLAEAGPTKNLIWQLFDFKGDNNLVLSLGVPVTADSTVSYIVSLVFV